ncbi:MAG: copper amine oxidase [Cyanobacteria bacterium]|nr:copper amine oxidase [Cyanobacteriota bacterium]
MRWLAESLLMCGVYEESSQYFLKTADKYEKIGDVNAAKALRSKAALYQTEIKIYAEKKANLNQLKKYYTAQKLEPIYGAYIGAFIDRDTNVSGTYNDDNSQLHRDEEEFNELTGKKHATFFMYLSYGNGFPSVWIKHLKNTGSAAHIAWEPTSGIDMVQEDDYLINFAQQAGDSGVPIFIRFAGEMNGDWTVAKYGHTPESYIQKFRLVARVMHQYAPNVAMVWCVNSIPEHNITKFYPGDDYVDWVGINFYSVLFYDNDPKRPADTANPADMLRYIYKTYSAKKPIMIGEYAATHFSRVDNVDQPDFTINKIAQLYSSLPRLFPRVKALHWYDSNNLINAQPGRQLNNYNLTEMPEILDFYKSMISSDYFLSEVSLDSPTYSDNLIEEIQPAQTLSGNIKLSAWVKTYVQRPTVIYKIDGQTMQQEQMVGTYQFTLNTKNLANGNHTLTLIVMDDKGKVGGKKEIAVNVKN